MLLGRIDQFGKLGWLTVTVLAFSLGWPAGLLVLAFLIGSGRAQAWRAEMTMPGGWFDFGGFGAGAARWAGFRTGSGNHAFDEYRKQTLDNLEAEQREFQAFLEQLRAARDKAEFDAFMEQRRSRAAGAGN